MANGIPARRWKSLLEHVAREQPDLYQPWFAALQPAELAGGHLSVQAGDDEHRFYLDASCRRAFAEAAQAVLGRLVSVDFVGPDGQAGETGGNGGAGPGDTGVFRAAQLAAMDENISFTPGYNFDNFVTGPGNRLAHAASVAVAESPGLAYNPLFVHGSVGLGKTHLLQAVCRGILDRQPDANIVYLSCDSFINQFIAAVEQGALHSFRYRYRHVDVLVIDDIHFLGDRERTQEEFFHTFNQLYQGQKQIVLSSDCPPAEIPDLEDRLVSRFNWGLVARIDPPSYETRVAITRKKARLRGVELADEVCSYLAMQVESNIREIEGALTKLVMTAQVEDQDITLELARRTLGGPAEQPGAREISVQQIMDAVMARYNIRLADLQSKKRNRSIAFPRQICMYLARRLTRHSLGEIGGYLGGRDHTTVLHACRTIDAAREDDLQLEATLKQLTDQLQNGAR